MDGLFFICVRRAGGAYVLALSSQPADSSVCLVQRQRKRRLFPKKEPPAYIGLGLMIAGVLVINLFSDSVKH